MTEIQDSQLAGKLEALATEYQICRQKLESKCEALLILSRELSECRSERDQFKLMAEQLRERYQVLKRQLAGHRPISPSHDSSCSVDLKQYACSQGQSLAQVLTEYREQKKSLQFEVDDLKQKLYDAQGDIKLLREQIVRSRVGTTDEGMNTRHFPAYEREDLVRQLEAAREQILQSERDLQQVLDEKQELVTERDAYRHKYERLNTELNYILKGDEKGVVDIDALIMENKYLHERLKQMEEEKSMAMETVSKYKSILEKKQNKGILKSGQSRSGGLVITQKQVKQILQSQSSLAPSPQILADLQSVCSALLDSVNDKSLALSHQRKTNKILGNRVAELEKKLKTLEVAGLWSVSGNMTSLEKLRQECEEVKMLVPNLTPASSEASDQIKDMSDLDTDEQSQTSSLDPSPTHRALARLGSPDHGPMTRKRASDHSVLSRLEARDVECDLDLLPTKEEVIKHTGEENGIVLPDQSCQDKSPDDISRSASETEHSSSLRKDEEEETSECENSFLLENEDQETETKFRNLMDSVTAKILERNISNRSSSLSEPATLAPGDTTKFLMVSMGGDSSTTMNLKDLTSTSPTHKMPLLQDKNEQINKLVSGEKAVDC